MYIDKQEDLSYLMEFKAGKKHTTDIVKGDLVFIAKNVRQEKLIMRKYIASLGAKQTHKLEEATIVVLQHNFNLSMHSMVFIPKGTYYNIDTYSYEVRPEFYSYSSHPINLQNHYNVENFLKKYTYCDTNSNVSAEYILTNTNIKYMSENDLQSKVIEWKNKTVSNKYDISDWDSVRDLLDTKEKDILKLLVTTLNNCNHEEILGRLIITYMRGDIPSIAKEALYKKVFIKRPELFKLLPTTPFKWGYMYSRSEILTYCKEWVSKEDLDALNVTE